MKNILLVEDEDVLRMLIADTLEDGDYTIDEAANGQEALELLQDHSYNLLILDYMMPVYSGMEVIEKVRADESFKNLKILMLSAKTQRFEQEEILNAGADYFMEKPFSPLKLLKKVKEILDED
ncbi:Response regulator receiver domain-containing protein [Bacillus sp. OV322]|uniref:response regulator n=1 Tax=Bacillus sp. OV322 TaxID=1882764 RepID=UPI0008E40E8C|nr:response regulator [Bacillus sp. OV322]SFC78329.1 Response regulator receiver domain-containing protein [Bacillus sp. OV322]